MVVGGVVVFVVGGAGGCLNWRWWVNFLVMFPRLRVGLGLLGVEREGLP